MTLQELVNNLSNKLAAMPSDTSVYIKAVDQQITNEVAVENTEKGQILIIR